MSPDDVLEAVRNAGVNCTRKTLLNYELARTIPKAIRGGYGQGKGRYSDYPENTPTAFFAAWHMINTAKITAWELENILELIKPFKSNPRDFYNLFFCTGNEENVVKGVNGAFQNLMRRNILFNVVRYVAYYTAFTERITIGLNAPSFRLYCEKEEIEAEILPISNEVEKRLQVCEARILFSKDQTPHWHSIEVDIYPGTMFREGGGLMVSVTD